MNFIGNPKGFMPKEICMLAHLYDSKRVIFPAYIQPKLDGVRAIWLHKEKRFISRKSKPLILNSNLLAELKYIPFDLDGELIIPGGSFNETSGIVRHQDMIPEKECLQYVVFDVIQPIVRYSERIVALKAFTGKRGFCQTNFLEYYEVFSFQDITKHHLKNLEQRYEGSIVRNNAPYEFKRSFNLLKLKPTKEITCKITGLIEGTGKYENMLGALTVETPEGKVFNVGSGFTDKDRDCIWLKDVKHYENTLVTVKYQDLSEYGIPRFPIFKGFV